MQATTKSAIVASSGQSVLKVFNTKSAFDNEVFIATLLRKDQYFVWLQSYDADHLILEYEKLAEIGRAVSLLDYSRHIAGVHTAYCRLPAAAQAVLDSFLSQQRRIQCALQPVGAENEVYRYVPCAILDQKFGHCGRRQNSSRLVQLDLEGMKFGASGIYDLAAVPLMFNFRTDDKCWRDCLEAYAETANSFGVPWTPSALARCCAEIGN